MPPRKQKQTVIGFTKSSSQNNNQNDNTSRPSAGKSELESKAKRSLIRGSKPIKQSNLLTQSFREIQTTISDELVGELSSSDSENGLPISKRFKSDSLNSRPDDEKDINDIHTVKGNVPWIEKYPPKSTRDIAIHPRKLSEIKEALQGMVSDPPSWRLVIVSGPPGTSKTTAVVNLAQEIGLSSPAEIVEWENPDRMDGKYLPEAFSDFLSGVKFRNKISGRPLIVVEDLPNVLHQETREKFNSALVEWIHYDKGSRLGPLVIIVTEVEITDNGYTPRQVQGVDITNSYTTERIFSKRLLDSPQVHRVKVLPIAPTILAKALKSIVSLEKLTFGRIQKKLTDQIIDRLSKYGDLRAAISALELWSRLHLNSNSALDSLLWTPSPPEKGLGLFHSIGKVIYGSTKSTSDPEIKDSSESSGFNGLLLLSAIFENYPSANGMRISVDTLNKITDLLSVCDTIEKVHHTAQVTAIIDQFTMQGVRTAISMDNFDSSQKKRFRPLVFPEDLKSFKARASEQDKISKAASKEMVSKLDMTLWYMAYRPMLLKSNEPGFKSSFKSEQDLPDGSRAARYTSSFKLEKEDLSNGLVFSEDEIED